MLVEIGAYDAYTYNYLFEKIKKVNVENAYGYLGSSTIKSKKIVLTNQENKIFNRIRLLKAIK